MVLADIDVNELAAQVARIVLAELRGDALPSASKAASDEPLLTIDEVSAELKIHKVTLLRYRKDGVIKGYGEGTRSIRFRLSEVLADMKKMERTRAARRR